MRHIQGEKFTYGDRRIIISKKKQKKNSCLLEQNLKRV